MVLRRRALVRGAMVGGAAYYAGRRVSQGDQREMEQQQRLEMLESQQYQSQQQARSVPPPAEPQASVVAQLTDLKKLLDAGVLTQAEFDLQKSRILQG